MVTATTFLSSLGVNTHIPYTDGAYANVAQDLADLQYLGITNVRDSVSNGANGSAPLSSYETLAKSGIRFTALIGVGGAWTPQTLTGSLSLIEQLNQAVPGSVKAVEGVNEINNWPITWTPTGGATESGLTAAVDLQTALYTAVHSSTTLAGVAVDYFTGYAAGGVAAGPNPHTTPGLADFDTQHPYPNSTGPAEASVAPSVALTNEQGDMGPAVYTETGYTTNSVSQLAQAQGDLDIFMDDARNGVSQTYLYDLLDAYQPGSRQGDDGYGLFDSNGNAKLAAVGIHDLTTILADTGTPLGNPVAAGFTVSGLPADGQSLDIEKSDGTHDFAVWNQTSGSQPVTVNFGAAYESVEIFDPLQGTNPIATYTDVSSVNLTLTGSPLIVQVSPQLAAGSGNGSATGSDGPPAITGVQPTEAASGTAPISPFTGVVISDESPTQTVTASITLSSTANGTLSDLGSGILSGDTYSVAGTAAQDSAAIDGLVFTPASAPGSSQTTTFTLSANHGSERAATTPATVLTVTQAPAPIGASDTPGAVATTDEAAPVHPFSSVAITDPNASQTETAVVSVNNAATGTLSDPNAATDGSTVRNGMITITGSAAAVAKDLDGLTFTPSAHQAAPGSVVSTTVSAAITDTANATTSLANTVNATAVNDAPTISVASSATGQALRDTDVIKPFTTAVVSDVDAGVQDSLTIVLSAAANGKLSGTGLTASTTTPGTYTLAAAAPATLTSELQALTFTPVAHEAAAGTTVTTSFALTARQTAGGTTTTSATNSTTTVVATETPAYNVINGPQDGHGFIKGTAGNDQITATGKHNAIFGNGGNDLIKAGDGEAVVTLGAGNSSVTLGAGYNAVLGGSGNTTVTGGPSGFNLVMLGNGNDTVTVGGTNDVIVLGTGTDMVSGTQGMSFITTGGGNDTIVLGGAHNTVNAGGGMNTISGGTGTNTFVLATAGQGFDSIAGFTKTNGDVLNLRAALAATQWNGQAATLANYLKVTDSGGSATVAIASTGTGPGTAVATLIGSGNLGLSDLISRHSIQT